MFCHLLPPLRSFTIYIYSIYTHRVGAKHTASSYGWHHRDLKIITTDTHITTAPANIYLRHRTLSPRACPPLALIFDFVTACDHHTVHQWRRRTRRRLCGGNWMVAAWRGANMWRERDITYIKWAHSWFTA